MDEKTLICCETSQT